ncbi:hypothetical protein ADA01nite_23880 [Aneurinibacillus danicus]|uniref:Uncharacterized protein n=1 Tax=Aneurinibacillus danicus TaxID=267746 RepID=A0A511VAK2_9BACL|nr:hypothetical protein ADA01nite_23880 [Aneurinibacillus danicus]
MTQTGRLHPMSTADYCHEHVYKNTSLMDVRPVIRPTYKEVI